MTTKYTPQVVFVGGGIFHVSLAELNVVKIERAVGDFKRISSELRQSLESIPLFPVLKSSICPCIRNDEAHAMQLQQYLSVVLAAVDVINTPVLREFFDLPPLPKAPSAPSVYVNPLKPGASGANAAASVPTMETAPLPSPETRSHLILKLRESRSESQEQADRHKIVDKVTDTPSHQLSAEERAKQAAKEEEERRRAFSGVQKRSAAEIQLATKFQAADAEIRVADNMAARQRRRATLVQGHTFIKHGRKGRPHARAVFITEDGLYICWAPEGKRNKAEKQPLATMTEVVSGLGTEVFRRVRENRGKLATLCFSLRFEMRTLDLQCASLAEREEWAQVFMEVLQCIKSGEPLW